MQRRALLSTIAAGTAILGGCGSSSSNTTRQTPDQEHTSTTPPGAKGEHTKTEGTATDDESDTPEPPADGFMSATTAVLETGDRTLSLLGGAHRLPSDVRIRSWLSDTATADHPATVTATIENQASYDTGIELSGVGVFDETPFAVPDGDNSKPGALYLVPLDGHEFATETPDIDRDGGFWYLDERPGDWQPQTVQLDAGETLVARLGVVTHVDAQGTFTPGRYGFGYHDQQATLVAWPTSTPGPTERSQFADTSPPAFEDMDPAWYHDADPSTPIYLQPSDERVAPPAQLEFTLHNYTRKALTGNRYDWALLKLVDGTWYHIEPWYVVLPLTPLPPGDTMTWTLNVFNESGVPDQDAWVLEYLGGGRYAFQVNMHPNNGATRAARFDLEAPDVTVTPMDDVQSSESGDTVSVSRPVSREGETGVLVVERADSATDRLIPEQVMRRRYRGLRNTLPFFEPGVSRVELQAQRQAVDDVLGHEDAQRRFRFDGQAYVASRGT